MANNYYIGVMSGTSMDGIDCVIADFKDQKATIIACESFSYPDSIKAEIQRIYQNNYQSSLYTLGTLDYQLGLSYSNAINQLIEKNAIAKADIRAIGCHGQTICHHTGKEAPFSLQIGNADLIATKTGIQTINNFRQKDVALGGEGAPLVPLFHQRYFANKEHNSVIVNLGGIANITCLNTDGSLLGFDTGPANTLIDAWIQKHKSCAFDQDGTWGSKGTLLTDLLEAMCQDAYFQKLPPKSTGLEYFNLTWLSKFLSQSMRPEDVQYTLHALSAKTLAEAIKKHQSDSKLIYLAGGGAKNTLLTSLIQSYLPQAQVKTMIDTFEIDATWIEALCFAWLAYCYDTNIKLNYQQITGSSRPYILGTLHRSE